MVLVVVAVVVVGSGAGNGGDGSVGGRWCYLSVGRSALTRDSDEAANSSSSEDANTSHDGDDGLSTSPVKSMTDSST